MIRPGKTGTITITYDAAHMGRFIKSALVYANIKNSPLELVLEGTVEGL